MKGILVLIGLSLLISAVAQTPCHPCWYNREGCGSYFLVDCRETKDGYAYYRRGPVTFRNWNPARCQDGTYFLNTCPVGLLINGVAACRVLCTSVTKRDEEQKEAPTHLPPLDKGLFEAQINANYTYLPQNALTDLLLGNGKALSLQEFYERRKVYPLAPPICFSVLVQLMKDQSTPLKYTSNGLTLDVYTPACANCPDATIVDQAGMQNFRVGSPVKNGLHLINWSKLTVGTATQFLSVKPQSSQAFVFVMQGAGLTNTKNFYHDHAISTRISTSTDTTFFKKVQGQYALIKPTETLIFVTQQSQGWEFNPIPPGEILVG